MEERRYKVHALQKENRKLRDAFEDAVMGNLFLKRRIAELEILLSVYQEDKRELRREEIKDVWDAMVTSNN